MSLIDPLEILNNTKIQRDLTRHFGNSVILLINTPYKEKIVRP